MLALVTLVASLSVSAHAQYESRLVAEVMPGAEGFDLLYAFTTFDDRLFFVGSTPEVGRELWAYDAGTDAIALVADLNPGPASAFLLPTFAALDGRLYFNAEDGTSGQELFVYDPVTDAISLVDDTTLGEQGFTVQLVVYDDRVFFTGVFSLRAYDPVTDTVEAVINDVIGFGIIGNLVVFGDRLVFSASSFDEFGVEPAFYDAASDTHGLLADVNPGTAASQPFSFAPYDGRLFFSAETEATGRELFVYDPVLDAATLAADAFPGATGSDVLILLTFDDRLFFAALDDAIAGTGRTIWAYDAATASVDLVADVDPDDPLSVTNPLGTPYAGAFFLAGDAAATGEEVYVYDPTTDAVRLAAGEIVPGPRGASLGGAALYEDRLFFGADDGENGLELWALATTATSAEDPLDVVSFRLGAPYPNPTSGSVSLDLRSGSPEPVRVEVYDALGRLVTTVRSGSARGTASLQLDTADLQPGTYVVCATVGTEQAMHRFVVLR